MIDFFFQYKSYQMVCLFYEKYSIKKWITFNYWYVLIKIFFYKIKYFLLVNFELRGKL